MQRIFSRVAVADVARLTVIVLLLAGAGCGQNFLKVEAKGKQRWEADEVDKLYFSACQAVQMEFGEDRPVRPQFTLILGAERNEAVIVKRELRLVKWDPSLFAEGVVIFAFEDLTTLHTRLLVARRAVALADSTVEVRTSRK